MSQQLLSRQQVADLLGVSAVTVARLTKTGALRAIKFNSRLIRYEPGEVETFMAGRRGIEVAKVGKTLVEVFASESTPVTPTGMMMSPERDYGVPVATNDV